MILKIVSSPLVKIHADNSPTHLVFTTYKVSIYDFHAFSEWLIDIQGVASVTDLEAYQCYTEDLSASQ